MAASERSWEGFDIRNLWPVTAACVACQQEERRVMWCVGNNMDFRRAIYRTLEHLCFKAANVVRFCLDVGPCGERTCGVAAGAHRNV